MKPPLSAPILKKSFYSPFSIIIILLLLLTPQLALALSKVALVIGNSNYRADPLPNPVNDAADMAGVLENLGFEVILDACRNNLFRSFRGVQKGLAEMKAPRGTIISYATSPGSLAEDGRRCAGRPGPAAGPAGRCQPGIQPKGRGVWKEPVPGMEFVWVPKGCYQIGCGPWTSECFNDEKPLHEVCLDGFWIGKYEITQGQWKKIMGSNPSHFKSGNGFPVESVSWNDAKQFTSRLNEQSGQRFGLPALSLSARQILTDNVYSCFHRMSL